MDKANLSHSYQELFGQPLPEQAQVDISAEAVLTALRQSTTLHNEAASVEQITDLLYEGASLLAVQIRLVELRAAGLIRRVKGVNVPLFQPVKHSLYNEYRATNPDLKVKKNF